MSGGGSIPIPIQVGISTLGVRIMWVVTLIGVGMVQ